MKILFLFILSILLPSFLLSQWVTQNLPVGSGNVLSVDFADRQYGLTCGGFLNFTINAKASYTTNGGFLWLTSEFPDSSRFFHDVKYFSSATAYMCGEYTSSRENTTLNGAFFLRSEDYGAHWKPVNSVYPDKYFVMEAMDFIDPAAGVAIASKFKPSTEEILYTTDSGVVWSRLYEQSDTLMIDFSELEYVNQDLIFATGVTVDKPVYSGVIIRSTNGGADWEHNVFRNFVINGISFLNAGTGMLCGTNALNSFSEIYRTTDGGISWIKVYTFTDDYYSGIKYFPASEKVLIFGYKVFLGERPVIQISGNNGYTWTSQALPITQETRLNCAAIPDLDHIYVAGGELFSNGTMLHSSNGGKTFVYDNSYSSHDPRLLQNYPNPFNPETKINIYIGKAAIVTLNVSDVRGKKIATLREGMLSQGFHEFYFNGKELPAGIYFYTLKTDSGSLTKKMLLIK